MIPRRPTRPVTYVRARADVWLIRFCAFPPSSVFELAGLSNLYHPGARFTNYLSTVLRQCQNYDRLTTDV